MRRGGLGDFLLSLPLLRELGRLNRPVCLVTRREYRELLPPGCRCDRFLDVDSPALGAWFEPEGRGAAPDGAEFLDGAAVYVFLQPDPVLERNLAAAAVDRIVWLDPKPNSPPHVAARFLHAAGFAIPDGFLEQPLWPVAPASGRALWLHPGSGSAAKNCPVPGLVDFVHAWQERNGREVIVSFGEADTALREPVASALRARNVSARTVCTPTLSVLKRQLRQHAGLYLGNDSGVSHLAAALGIPALVVFRCTDPQLWRPLGPCRPVRCEELKSPEWRNGALRETDGWA